MILALEVHSAVIYPHMDLQDLYDAQYKDTGIIVLDQNASCACPQEDAPLYSDGLDDHFLQSSFLITKSG